MQLSIPKTYLALLLIGVTLILLGFYWSNSANQIPQAPVYTNSTLVDQISHTRSGVFYPLVTYTYSSEDSPDHVLDFYAQHGDCTESEFDKNRTVCHGNTAPSGDYTVYIDSPIISDNLTTFILEVRWDR
jgi:hypothetical protein